ncbi:MAG: hypothetical protein V3R81_11910, partial [Gammaproteobacteria bacterium]
WQRSKGMVRELPMEQDQNGLPELQRIDRESLRFVKVVRDCRMNLHISSSRSRNDVFLGV